MAVSSRSSRFRASAFPTPAQRPHNSRLSTARLQQQFGLSLPHWQLGVDRMLTETFGN